MSASTSSGPVIQNDYDTEYMAVADEVVTIMDEEEITERKLVLKILEEYKKEDFANVTFSLSCNRFSTAIKGILRKLYSKIYDHWNQKHGRMDVMEMPYPIREGRVNSEYIKDYALYQLVLHNKGKPEIDTHYRTVSRLTNMTHVALKKYIRNKLNKVGYHENRSKGGSYVLKHVKGSTTFTPNDDESDELVELCRKFLDDFAFKNHMQAADEYLASVDESNVDDSIKDRLVLLKFLVAVRRGDAKKMYEVVDANNFTLANQEAMRILYRKGYNDYVVKNGIHTRQGDPMPWPRSINLIKIPTKEEQDVLEAELRKKLDNLNYSVDYWGIAERLNRSKKSVNQFIDNNVYESWNKSREEQDKLREERWAAIERQSALLEAKKKAFERRHLVGKIVRKQKPRKPRAEGYKKMGPQKKIVINSAPVRMGTSGRQPIGPAAWKKNNGWISSAQLPQTKIDKKVTFTLSVEAPVETDIPKTGDILENDEEFLTAFDELSLLMEQAADIIKPSKAKAINLQEEPLLDHMMAPEDMNNQMEEGQVVAVAGPSEQHLERMNVPNSQVAELENRNDENEVLQRRRVQKRESKQNNEQLPKRPRLSRQCRNK